MRLLCLSLLFFYLLPLNAQADGFGLHASANLGSGRLGTDNGSLQSRNMYGLNLEALPGYTIHNFLGGVFFDYGQVGQATSLDSAGNALGGHEYSIGLGLAYQPPSWKLVLSYDFIGKYSVSSGMDLQFSHPSGIHLLAGYGVAPHSYFDLEFSSINYHRETAAGVESDISGDSVNHWNFALGISIAY